MAAKRKWKKPTVAQDNEGSKKPEGKYEAYAKETADRVIAALENGTAPWQRPWKAGVPAQHGEGMPYNAISGIGYKGSNAVNLMMVQTAKGYQDDRWVTFKQAQDLGCSVKKGSKSVPCIKWNPIDKAGSQNAGDPASRDERRGGMFPSFFSVFNGDQIEGMPPAPVREMPTEKWRHDECERLMKECGVPINHGGNSAYYRPSTDSIQLPPKDAFPNPDGYYGTALHEIGHSTGHKTRLARDQTGAFGSESYAKEELVAELGSLMMGDALGIGHCPDQHVAYVQHWIKILQDDPKQILIASTAAGKVCEHLGIERYQHQATRAIEKTQEQIASNDPDLLPQPIAAMRLPDTAMSPLEDGSDRLTQMLVSRGRIQQPKREQGWDMSM
jgi:antirestriction protein ArdC